MKIIYKHEGALGAVYDKPHNLTGLVKKVKVDESELNGGNHLRGYYIYLQRAYGPFKMFKSWIFITNFKVVSDNEEIISEMTENDIVSLITDFKKAEKAKLDRLRCPPTKPPKEE